MEQPFHSPSFVYQIKRQKNAFRHPVQKKAEHFRNAPCPGPTKNRIHTIRAEASCQIMRTGTIQLDTILLQCGQTNLYLVGSGMSVNKLLSVCKEPDSQKNLP